MGKSNRIRGTVIQTFRSALKYKVLRVIPILYSCAFTIMFSCQIDQGSSEALPSHTTEDALGKLDSMVLVPGGWFIMGCNKGEEDEKPERKVWIDSFRITQYPVTNRQYAQFIAETGHRIPRYWKNKNCNAPLQAVVGVSWDDAVEYCRWKSRKKSTIYRLPTEAEWEKAARGTNSRKYPWGNNKPSRNHADTRLKEKMPAVGMCTLGMSPYGCYDMTGNIWQWCADWYDRNYYQIASDRNPLCTTENTRNGRVVRGGNWVFLGCCSGSPEYALRCVQRNAFHPKLRKKSVGFRCVKVLSSNKERS